MLNDKFNIFLTMITISGGGYLLILDKLFKLLRKDNYIIKFPTLVILLMSIIISILYIKIFIDMYNVYYGNKYEYLGTSKDIEEKRKEIKKYYDKYYKKYYKITGKSKKRLIDEDIQEDLKEKFINAYDYNFEKNNNRMNDNIRLNRTILITATFIIVTYIIMLAIPYTETTNITNQEPILIERSDVCEQGGNKKIMQRPSRTTTKARQIKKYSFN